MEKIYILDNIGCEVKSRIYGIILCERKLNRSFINIYSGKAN